MTKILEIDFVRHGQEKWNAAMIFNGREGDRLTERGRQQARSAGKELRGTKGVIYSSPLARARETADIISEETGLGPAIIVPDLIERAMGPLTGKSKLVVEAYEQSKFAQSAA